jgi:hypothetical protein
MLEVLLLQKWMAIQKVVVPFQLLQQQRVQLFLSVMVNISRICKLLIPYLLSRDFWEKVI